MLNYNTELNTNASQMWTMSPQVNLEAENIIRLESETRSTLQPSKPYTKLLCLVVAQSPVVYSQWIVHPSPPTALQGGVSRDLLLDRSASACVQLGSVYSTD